MWSFLGAFVGGVVSLFSGLSRSLREQDEIWERQQAERRMREARVAEMRARAEREIEYAKQSFEMEKRDAFKKAGDIWKQGERIDAKSDLDETLTGRAFNLAIKRGNLAEDNALNQEQRAKQNFENAQGAFKASLGVSGTRAGSSSSEGLLEQNAENFNQDLSLMQRQRQAEKEIGIMSAWAGLKQGMLGIDEQRDTANMAFRDSSQLRADYSAGGRVVNLFNKRIENRRADLEGEVNLINLGGEIQQAAMQRQYDRAQYSFFDAAGDIFKGATSGFNAGSSVGNFIKNWGGGGGGFSVGFSNTNMQRNPFGNLFGGSDGAGFGHSWNVYGLGKIRR